MHYNRSVPLIYQLVVDKKKKEMKRLCGFSKDNTDKSSKPQRDVGRYRLKENTAIHLSVSVEKMLEGVKLLRINIRSVFRVKSVQVDHQTIIVKVFFFFSLSLKKEILQQKKNGSFCDVEKGS